MIASKLSSIAKGRPRCEPWFAVAFWQYKSSRKTNGTHTQTLLITETRDCYCCIMTWCDIILCASRSENWTKVVIRWQETVIVAAFSMVSLNDSLLPGLRALQLLSTFAYILVLLSSSSYPPTSYFIDRSTHPVHLHLDVCLISKPRYFLITFKEWIHHRWLNVLAFVNPFSLISWLLRRMPCGRFLKSMRRQQLRSLISLCIAGVALFNAYIAKKHHHNLAGEAVMNDSLFLVSASQNHNKLIAFRTTLIPSPQQEQLQRATSRRVLFVHIGKTGGETIRQTLRVACRMRQNPTLQESCLNKFQNDPSLGQTPLNLQTIGTIHCLLMVPSNALVKATTLLVSVRNPIERVISWFRYLHPANCNPSVDKQSTACNVKKALKREKKEARKRKLNNKVGKKLSWTSRFFSCFDSLPQVGLALKGEFDAVMNTSDGPDSNCSVLAQKTIRGMASPVSSHMHFNYEYYWNQTLTLRPELETMTVRTETLWEDLDHVQSLLHFQDGSSSGTTSQYKLPPRNNHTHGSESHSHVDSILGPALRYLCCALSREIYFYAGWIHRAVNLEPVDKAMAMDGVTKYCSIVSDHHDTQLVWTDLALLQSVLCDS